MTAARARIRRAPLIVPCLLLACPVPGAAAEPLEEVVVTASLRR